MEENKSVQSSESQKSWLPCQVLAFLVAIIVVFALLIGYISSPNAEDAAIVESYMMAKIGGEFSVVSVSISNSMLSAEVKSKRTRETIYVYGKVIETPTGNRRLDKYTSTATHPYKAEQNYELRVKHDNPTPL
jgi:hypothetical protein